MSTSPITTTASAPNRLFPSKDRPVRVIARNLAADELLRQHQHPWGQVTYALDGVMQVHAKDSTWFVPPLRAIWIPANVAHEVRIIETARLRAIYIHQDVAPIKGDQCVVLEVSALMRELVLRLAEQDPAGQRENHLVAVLLDELAIAESLPMRVAMPHDKRLKTLCLTLIDDPSSNLTLDDLACQVGASARTLARLFEKDLGMSFVAWRQQMRLARAAPLIAGGMPLSQVASELGYASQSALTAMFKKAFGQSPSVFFKHP
ncbi:helix-turn-helix transcriptional regulator [Undibacterium sp. RTI2.1]|uniref:AraC family transcriptional regulator n=1 Tax=unclassified Undibacterium TaxID=2630295 RepID=UPI002AB56AEF|nr:MULTISPECIES: helix-turn-helix transcriptional regulator [unclassified Undibacterium]MDY7537066.1 helix-turn-helix transcriptional regulator [Undibacterium sp. 5I1]MEB0030398.1 helix-turn-helix transcriptional regulator [Undibacterium sp. RTI2.1]MEB0115180.1 helix-turn-helix transcriptional regulator [Undibacterium sp. RTI2.2]MEB0229244.1 helix-turn-helix transcriptional regulator [Undibacterium sp. 10I3]MEB0256208.1 helix-turn-helix transcriptional regulator [Undibacterium sp. 5I1]